MKLYTEPNQNAYTQEAKELMFKFEDSLQILLDGYYHEIDNKCELKCLLLETLHSKLTFYEFLNSVTSTNE